MARIIERNIATLVQGSSLTLGQQNRLRLPLGATVQAYRLRLTGTLTVATAAATVLEDSPLGLLRQVDLVLGGGFPLRSLDARAIRFFNILQHGTAPRLTAPSGSIGSSNFAAEIILDLWQPDLLYGLPRAFWLDTRFLSSLELLLTVGDAPDVATPGGGGTVSLSNVQVGVDAVEVLDRGGLLSRMQVLRQVVQAVTATGTLDLQPFAGGGVIYRGLAIHATSGNSDPNRATSDDTVVGDVTVFDSRGIRHVDAVPWERLRAETKRIHMIESLPAGWAFVSWARERHLDDLLDTRGAQNLQVRLTIAAAPSNAFVQVYPWVVLLRRGPQASQAPVMGRPVAVGPARPF